MKRKKVISGTLAIFMCVSFLSTSVASASTINDEVTSYYTIESEPEIEEVVLDDGSVVEVEIIETTEIPGGADFRDFSAKYKIGTRKTYKARITNDQLGAPGILTGGISVAQKKKLVKAAAKAITKKMGASFLPGINLVSYLLSTIGYVNSKKGNRGFEIGCTVKYSKTHLHKEGFDIYGWTPISAYVRGYK